jgi:hypothetical protein
MSQGSVCERNNGVEVSATDRREDENDHEEAERGGEGVLEQLQPDVVRRKPFSRNAGSDDDRGKQRATNELGGDAPIRAGHEVTSTVASESSAPGTRA